MPKGSTTKRFNSGIATHFSKGEGIIHSPQCSKQESFQDYCIAIVIAERKKDLYQKKRARVIAGIIKYKEEQKKIEMEK